MTKDLVFFKKNQALTSSIIFSENFGIAHIHILEKIKKLTIEISIVKNLFTETTYTNNRGRKYPMYVFNRDGYMFLVMNIGTKKANEIKLKFISAFNLMEKRIIQEQSNKDSVQWLAARQQSKLARKEEPDVIQEFIDYATKQGSKNAKFYYKHFTSATYKTLNLIQYKKPKLRETLNFLETCHLVSAENAARKSIKKHMDNEEHYKVIFELVKQDLEKLADSLFVKKIND